MDTEAVSRWRVGAHVGQSVWTLYVARWPLAVFTASSEVLTISWLGNTLSIPREHIVRLIADYANVYLTKPGLHIEHDIEDAPPFVFIYSGFRLNIISASLREMGYLVEEKLE